jgi:hypothetical protein
VGFFKIDPHVEGKGREVRERNQGKDLWGKSTTIPVDKQGKSVGHLQIKERIIPSISQKGMDIKGALAVFG